MESIEIKSKSMITINNVVFGNVTINVTDYGILNVFNSNNCWICGIGLVDIKTFTSTSLDVYYKVNKLISEFSELE